MHHMSASSRVSLMSLSPDPREAPQASGGLRSRKRAATQETIERAAISLALEHGYEHVTVDMICEASMVSQRTFFNYFGSKEGVILGGTPPMPTDEEIDAFARATGSNLLADFVTLITSALLKREPDADLFNARRMLIMRTPELADQGNGPPGRIRGPVRRHHPDPLRGPGTKPRQPSRTGRRGPDGRRADHRRPALREASMGGRWRAGSIHSRSSSQFHRPDPPHHQLSRSRSAPREEDSTMTSMTDTVLPPAPAEAGLDTPHPAGLRRPHARRCCSRRSTRASSPRRCRRSSANCNGVDHMLWVTTAYILASTIMLPVYGKLGDLIGRKGLFIAAIACSSSAPSSAAWHRT